MGCGKARVSYARPSFSVGLPNPRAVHNIGHPPRTLVPFFFQEGKEKRLSPPRPRPSVRRILSVHLSEPWTPRPSRPCVSALCDCRLLKRFARSLSAYRLFTNPDDGGFARFSPVFHPVPAPPPPPSHPSSRSTTGKAIPHCQMVYIRFNGINSTFRRWWKLINEIVISRNLRCCTVAKFKFNYHFPFNIRRRMGGFECGEGFIRGNRS